MTIFTNLDALVNFAKLRSQRGFFTGKAIDANRKLMDLCTHRYNDLGRGIGAMIIFTRDVGYHTSGWWKNPDYERCLHLSIGAREPHTGTHIPKDSGLFEELAGAFFGDDKRLTWCEGPYSPEGKAAHIWHYRLFCDPSWAPILPRGEVYSTEFTEAGWKSFSDIHPLPAEGEAA